MVEELPGKFIPKPILGLATRTFLAAFLLGGCAAPPEAQVSKPGVSSTSSKDLSLHLPFSNTWFLTGGPHSDGLSNGKRYALDFSPPEVIACPGGKPLENRFVEASGSGTVKRVGNEKDPTDKYHSIVEIEHINGLTTGYMHLANMRVRVDDKVEAGAKLGNPSCDKPPGGNTNGEHNHFYVLLNGQPTDIAGFEFSGWKAVADEGNYQGRMVKGNLLRIANVGRCPTDNACNGLRNDLIPEEFAKNIPTPTKTTVPTPTNTPRPIPTSTPTERAPEVGFKTFRSSINNQKYQIDYPNNWSIISSNKGDAFAISKTEYTSVVVTTGIESRPKVDLTSYKDEILSPYKTMATMARSYGWPANTTETFMPKGVDGRDAWIIEYTDKYDHLATVVFIDKELGWKIILNDGDLNDKGGNPPAEPAISLSRQKYTDILKKMVSSFKLLR